MNKKLTLGILAVLVAGLLAVLTAAADQPLSADDITLLLLGGSSKDKIVSLVEQRGINFQMNPDLAKKFHDAGAGDDLIDALTKAGLKPKPPASSPVPDSSPAPSEPAAAPAQQTQSANTPAPNSPPGDVNRKVAETLSALESKPGDVGSTSGYNNHPYAGRFSLVALSGQKVDLADYKGKVVLLSFWATWCPHCRELIPALVGFQGQYRAKGLQVVGIAIRDHKEAVRSFCQRENLNYPVAMGDDYTANLYGGLKGLPTTILIGRDGRIYSSFAGAPEDFGPIEDRINALLALPASGAGSAQQAAAQPAPTAVPAQQAQSAGPSTSAKTAEVDRKVAETLKAVADTPPVSTSGSGSAASSKSAETMAGGSLADPSPDQVQHIIQQFAAKEKLFKEARNNYTYHQINKVEELGADNEVEGVWEQEWDILFDDAGNRIERVTYAPSDSLKRVIMTKEDYVSMRNTQPFVMTSDDLPEYEVKYLGHVKVDEITAYVFSVRPKELEKGKQYFKGVVWVDDRDLQIVKSEGKPVPELKTSKGENLFPRFTTYREQVDGKYWFPTYTMADDTLYFSNGPVHLKQVIRYTDYKQFKSKVRILSATPTDRPNAPPIPGPPNQ